MRKLFNISEATNIAIHSMALISASKDELNATQIADMLKLSKNHVAKIMNILARQRFVSSTRGPKGGFKMLRESGSISLLEIFELMDGSLEQDHCRRIDGICPFSDCVFGDVRQRLFTEFKTYYQNRMLSDLSLKY
jgi:Rrf2 family protein